jgi:hypothetical protein
LGNSEKSVVKPKLRTIATIVAAFVSLVLRTETAEAHPLHTSLAELTYDQKSGAVLLSLRVFVEDYTKASTAYAQKHAQPVSAGAAVSPLVTYALASFALTDSRGRRVAFTSCGGKRVGDLMWLCFRGSVPGRGSGLHVGSEILFDTFRDQINIVQASYSGHHVNLLFTPGEASKALPP